MNSLNLSLNVFPFLLMILLFFMIISILSSTFVLFSLFSNKRASNKAYWLGSQHSDTSNEYFVSMKWRNIAVSTNHSRKKRTDLQAWDWMKASFWNDKDTTIIIDDVNYRPLRLWLRGFKNFFLVVRNFDLGEEETTRVNLGTRLG